MTTALLTALLMFATQIDITSTLPGTAQGKRVQAWVTAFNTGDEKAFLAAQRAHLAKAAVERRPEAERAKMFQRMRGDFGTIKIEKIVKTAADAIQFTARTKEGGLGTFTFEFESQAPYLIASLGIDVERGGE